MLRRILAITIIGAMLAGCGRRSEPTLAEQIKALAPGLPLKVPISTKPWKYPGGVGKVFKSKHYTIYASSHRGRMVADLPGFLEAAYVNYLKITSLGELADGTRMDVYMMNTRQEWVALTKSVFGQDAMALSIGAGGYCYKGVGVYWDLRHRSTFAIAAHEGLHQFIYHRTKNRLPLCIEEGLAVNAEGFHFLKDSVVFLPHHNPSRFLALRRAIVHKRWITIDRLLDMNAADYLNRGTEYSVGWYGQVWALVQFLRSNDIYSKGLQQMLCDAQAGLFHKALGITKGKFEWMQKRGRSYNIKVSRPLFEHYITNDLKTFEREYRAFALKLAKLDNS